MESGQIERDVRARLRERAIRWTETRRRIVIALAGRGRPSSAAELFAATSGAVPLSSLYRNLALLTEAGVLARSHERDGVARFELAEWLLGHHHHLVCLSCGRVEDLAVPPGDDEALTALVARAAGRQGFMVTGHRVDVEGLCSRCRAA